MRRALGIVILLSACGTKDRGEPLTSRTAIEETCRTTVATRAGPSTAPNGPPPPPVHASRIIAHVEMKLAPVVAELEKNVPRRVAEERGRDIGVAGSLNVTVDRGPFTATVEGESLLVRTELRGHAEACAKGSCYAGCDPVAIATAAVPLRLTPDYRFAPSRVSVSFTRGCRIRALGGFVTVDVTDAIEKPLGPALRRVEHQIDARIPQPRPHVERMWTELNTPRSLPLGACAVVNPRALVQGPMTGAPGSVRMRFGLAALPELRTRCGDPPPAVALPSLAHDPQLPAEDDLVVALVWPLTKVSSSLASSDPFMHEGARVRVADAKAVAANADLDVDLVLRGEACGPLALRTAVAWKEDGTALVMTELADGPRIQPPVQPESLKTMIPEVASALSDPSALLKARVAEAKPLEGWARGEDLVATVRVRGAIDITPK